ncbi:MAG TPA: hypothetical protein VHX44_09130, partial [Planctomycetota bacterium]|nr:hypothetical protein [Planctomycetota bacterium]
MTFDLRANPICNAPKSAGGDRRTMWRLRVLRRRWCLCLLAMGGVATAAEPALSPGIAVLKALPIEAGTITSVEHVDAATAAATKGSAPGQLPRTMVKLVLTPAKGSHINVEVWLPDAEQWNRRFIGLGNGGAAGKINPGTLAGASSGGNAVATT